MIFSVFCSTSKAVRVTRADGGSCSLHTHLYEPTFLLKTSENPMPQRHWQCFLNSLTTS